MWPANLSNWLQYVISEKSSLNPEKETYEFEIRFKSFRPPRAEARTNQGGGRSFNKHSPEDSFQYGLPFRDFDRLKRFLDVQYGPATESYQTDYNRSGGKDVTLRKSVIPPSTQEGTNKEVWLKKTRELNYKDYNYYLRYVISKEERIAPIKDFQHESCRVKKRWSYYPMGGIFRIDITEVTMCDESHVIKPSYEVELEVLDIPQAVNPEHNYFGEIVTIMLKTIHDTAIVYNSREYRTIVKYVNDTLGLRTYDSYTFNHNGLFQARNLHYRDMVFGGLAGNPEYSYSVTIKADGIRKLLVVHESGIWLVMGPDEANLVLRPEHLFPMDSSGADNQTADLQGVDEYRSWIGYIMEGEYLPRGSPDGPLRRMQGAPDVDYWFLIYDCLAIPYKYTSFRENQHGNKAVQKEHHSVRIAETQKLADHFKDHPALQLTTKNFYGFNTPERFFQIIRQLERLKPTNSYIDDGYIITAEEMPYDNITVTERKRGREITRDITIWKLPLRQRKLSRYPDICKWKPPNQLTIDFHIKWSPLPDGRRIIVPYVGSSQISKDRSGKTRYQSIIVPFQGTDVFPYASNERYPYGPIDHQNKLTENVPDGTIVEYQWKAESGLLEPIRLRLDKSRPNREEFANDTWNLIQNPINIETLRGDDFKLMSKSHNRIKWSLFKTAYESLTSRRDFSRLGSKSPSHSSQEKPFLTVLDIGSGRGGDVLKLAKFDRILFVEPDFNYLPELASRIQETYQQSSVQILTSNQSLDINGQRQIEKAFEGKEKAIILNTGGENSSLIRQVVDAWLGGTVSLISLMLSMSFFWSSNQMVKALETTILENLSPQGEVIFLTIDGQLVEQAFSPAMLSNGRRMGGQSQDYDTLNLIDAQFKVNKSSAEIRESVEKGKIDGPETAKLVLNRESSSLNIHIPGTIVQNQTEYLVYLNDLRSGFRERQFEIISLKTADQELFLNPAELVLTKLYTSGRIVNSDLAEEIIIKEIEKNHQSNLQNQPGLVSRKKGTKYHQGHRQSFNQKLSGSHERPSGGGGLPEKIHIAYPRGLKKVSQSDRLKAGSTSNQRIKSRINITKPSKRYSSQPLIRIGDRQGTYEEQLPMLSVLYNHRKDIGTGDDFVQTISCKWYNQHPVIRIATIGNGSCFFHAILKAFYAPYANKISYSHRVKMVQNFRRDLAAVLELEDPDSVEGKTYYQTAARGAWVDFAEQQLLGASLDFDFRLLSIQKLLNSSQDVGNEVYQFVGDLIGIDIYVVMATKVNLHPMLNTSRRDRHQPAIIIAGNGYHYETIGINRGSDLGIQTVFYQNDPFLKALRSQIADEEGSL